MGSLSVVLVAVMVAMVAMGSGGLSTWRPAQTARIFGGSSTGANEFPTQVYIVSLRDNNGHVTGFFCGGTILSPTWILTAAHCLEGSLQTIVGYGSAFKDDLFYIEANRIIPHEGYRVFGRFGNNAEHDIGLIELKSPIPLDRINTDAAFLPEEGDDLGVGRGSLVVGWGRWSYAASEENAGSTIALKKLEVDVIDCPIDIPNAICVVNPLGTGVCDGDSGGPLLLHQLIFGIVSYVDLLDQDPHLNPNRHCDDPEAYVVFMSVPAYRGWIRQHTGL